MYPSWTPYNTWSHRHKVELYPSFSSISWLICCFVSSVKFSSCCWRISSSYWSGAEISSFTSGFSYCSAWGISSSFVCCFWLCATWACCFFCSACWAATRCSSAIFCCLCCSAISSCRLASASSFAFCSANSLAFLSSSTFVAYARKSFCSSWICWDSDFLFNSLSLVFFLALQQFLP